MPDPTDPYYETWMKENGYDIPEIGPIIIEKALSDDSEELPWMDMGISAGAGFIFVSLVALIICCIMKKRNGANKNQSSQLVEDN